MAKMLSRVAPWLTSASREAAGTADAVPADPYAGIRPLEHADTERLWELVRADPVANVFLAAHLESAGTAGPTPSGAQILGMYDGGALTGACWAGVNAVPVGLDAEQGARLGAHLAASGDLATPRQALEARQVLSIARPRVGPFRQLLHHRISDNFLAPVMMMCGIILAGSDERTCRASSACRGVARLAKNLGVGNVVYVNVIPRITPNAAALDAMINSLITREGRSTDALSRVREELIGPEADAAIVETVHHSDFVVVVSGHRPTCSVQRARALQYLRAKDVYAVGPLNNGGWPWHPSARRRARRNRRTHR